MLMRSARATAVPSLSALRDVTPSYLLSPGDRNTGTPGAGEALPPQGAVAVTMNWGRASRYSRRSRAASTSWRRRRASAWGRPPARA